MRISNSWAPLITGIAADVATLTSRDYGNAVYNAAKFDIPKDWNAKAVAIAFWGTDAADEAVTAILWGRMRTNGPIIKLWAGAVTLGTLKVITDPITKAAVHATEALWADTITLTANVEGLADAVIRNESVGNDIAFLFINLYGIVDLYMEITTINTATTINAIICGITDASIEWQLQAVPAS